MSYVKGEHKVSCQRCFKEVLSSKARKEWTGLIICKSCWEPRHPQDFVRARPDNQSAKGLISPEPEETYVTGICHSTFARAGDAVAGCAVAGDDTLGYNYVGTFNQNTL